MWSQPCGDFPGAPAATISRRDIICRSVAQREFCRPQDHCVASSDILCDSGDMLVCRSTRPGIGLILGVWPSVAVVFQEPFKTRRIDVAEVVMACKEEMDISTLNGVRFAEVRSSGPPSNRKIDGSASVVLGRTGIIQKGMRPSNLRKTRSCWITMIPTRPQWSEAQTGL